MLEDIADLANTQTQGETQNEDTKNTCPKQQKKKNRMKLQKKNKQKRDNLPNADVRYWL